MPFTGENALGLILKHQADLLDRKRQSGLDRITAMQAQAQDAREGQLHKLRMMKEVTAVLKSLEDDQEAGTRRAAVATDRALPAEIAKAAMGELGTVDLRSVAEGTAPGLEFATGPERDEVLNEIRRLGVEGAQEVGRRELAPVEEQLAQLSEITGRPVDSLRSQLFSEMDSSVVDRNRKAATEADSALRRLESLEAARDAAVADALNPNQSEAQLQRNLGRLRTRQARLNKEVGGDQAIVETEKLNRQSMKLARNAKDLDTMAATIDGFQELVRTVPQSGGVVAALNLLSERIGGSLEDITGVPIPNMVEGMMSIAATDEDAQQLSAEFSDTALQGATDLDLFSKVLALKIAQTSSPDRFAFALYEEFRDTLNFTGVRSRREVLSKLSSAQKLVEQTARNSRAVLESNTQSPLMDPALSLRLRAGSANEIEIPGGGPIQFESLQRLRSQGVQTDAGTPAAEPSRSLEEVMGMSNADFVEFMGN